MIYLKMRFSVRLSDAFPISDSLIMRIPVIYELPSTPRNTSVRRNKFLPNDFRNRVINIVIDV